MNTENAEKKEVIMRSLAVAGLVTIICFIAWLSVQIVKVAPSAFTSLASLAEGISQYEDTLNGTEPGELTINKTSNLVDSGDQTTLSWFAEDETGSYAFLYECVDGVSVSVTNEDGVRNIDCATNYNLGDVSDVKVIMTSTNERYTDVTYTVSFTKEGEAVVHSIGSESITVSNRNIADFVDESDEVATATTTDSEDDSTDDTTEDTGGYSYEYEFEYKIPVSDPNGFVDLEAKFLTVGGIVNNTYRAGTLEQDSTGAIQFSVKNLGTKTSDTWKFTISLPDGTDYESSNQTPLKPNEEAVLTIGIQTGDDSSHTFIVEVETDEDIRTANNDFSQRVTILN